MANFSGAYPRPTGGGSRGQHNGPNLPDWLDPDKVNGSVTVLEMKPKEGNLPKNPFIVESSVVKAAGKICDAYLNKTGNVVMKIRNPKQVESLLKLEKLEDGTEVKVDYHPVLNRTKIVISCSELIDLTDEAILEGLRKRYDVIEIHRIKRKVESGFKITPTMIITLNGTVAPSEIFVGFLRCPTRLYIPSPMQCFNCFRFGHTKNRCDRKAVCRNCSKEHDIVQDSNGLTVCYAAPYCRNCTGDHQLASRKCPTYTEEEMTIVIKTEAGVSMGEARKRAKKVIADQKSGSTFAEAAANSTELAKLQGELRNMQLQISNNQEALKELQKLKELSIEYETEIDTLKKELERARQANKSLAANNKSLKAALGEVITGKTIERTATDSESEADMQSARSDTEPKSPPNKAQKKKRNSKNLKKKQNEDQNAKIIVENQNSPTNFNKTENIERTSRERQRPRSRSIHSESRTERSRS